MPRPRVRRTVLGLCAVVLAAVSACAEPEPDLELQVPGRVDGALGVVGTPSPSSTAETSCSTQPAAGGYDVATLNRAMQGIRLPDWRAGDVGATAPLSDGRMLWVFGDTLRAKGARPGIVANSMLVSSGTCFTPVAGSSGAPVLDLQRTGQACWPTSVLARKAMGGDSVSVICSRVQQDHHGLLDFTYLGASLAEIRVPVGGRPVVEHMTTLTPDNHDPRAVNWGAAQVVDGDWLYVYGTQQAQGELAKSALVARVRLEQMRSFPAWQFYDGRQWQEDPGWARPVLSASPGVSQAFSVHRLAGRFVLVSKRGGEFGDAIGVWTAPSPVGPWTLTSETPYAYDEHNGFVRYQPLAHPEIRLANGKLLVSLSRNPTTFANLLTDPRRGRPVFVEVPHP